MKWLDEQLLSTSIVQNLLRDPTTLHVETSEDYADNLRAFVGLVYFIDIHSESAEVKNKFLEAMAGRRVFLRLGDFDYDWVNSLANYETLKRRISDAGIFNHDIN